MVEHVVFWILAAGTVLSAIAVISPQLTRTPIHSALALVVCFLFLSGLYAMLAAHVLAAIQVLVYAGAIMVLFLFVIMLLNLGAEPSRDVDLTGTKVLAGLLVLFACAKIFAAIQLPSARLPAADLDTLPDDPAFGTLASVADQLFHRFLVPFELLGILLLVALVGALVLAKRSLDLPAPPDEDGDGAAAHGGGS